MLTRFILDLVGGLGLLWIVIMIDNNITDDLKVMNLYNSCIHVDFSVQTFRTEIYREFEFGEMT